MSVREDRSQISDVSGSSCCWTLTQPARDLKGKEGRARKAALEADTPRTGSEEFERAPEFFFSVNNCISGHVVFQALKWSAKHAWRLSQHF